MVKKNFPLSSGNEPDWLNSIPAITTKDGDLKLMPENNELISVIALAPSLKVVSKRTIANNFAGVLD
jgi:hypothetical protein